VEGGNGAGAGKHDIPASSNWDSFQGLRKGQLWIDICFEIALLGICEGRTPVKDSTVILSDVAFVWSLCVEFHSQRLCGLRIVAGDRVWDRLNADHGVFRRITCVRDCEGKWGCLLINQVSGQFSECKGKMLTDQTK
jgi:hypothetical protein